EALQNDVYEILKFTITQHFNIFRHLENFINKHKIAMVLSSTSVIIAIGSSSYFIYAKIHPDINISMIIYMGTSVIFALIFLNYSQLLINDCDDFYMALCECPWIYWNKKNRQIYHLMLVLLKKPMYLSVTGQVFNRVYLITLLRFGYSMFAFARGLTSKQK
ncbi:unnamed protein product, partial [Phyllotreta striolata]